MATLKSLDGIHPFAGRDVTWLIEAQAAAFADRSFLIWEPADGARRVWSYAQFAESVREVAATLSLRGVGEGDFVLLHMDNCPEFLFAWCACARLGAVAVGTNTHSTQDELTYFVAHSRASVALTEARYLDLVRASAPELRWIAVREDAVGAWDERILPWLDSAADPERSPRASPDPSRLCNVIYTSGTTSRPKGVEWTHSNALSIGKTTSQIWGLRGDDVNLMYLPLFHSNALGLSFLGSLWSGGTVVMIAKWSTSRFWEVSVRNGCTWTVIIGFALRALFEQEVPKHRYRLWLGPNMKAVCDRFSVTIYNAFGMTETAGSVLSSDHATCDADLALGFPTPGYEVEVRGVDGTPVQGDEGDLWVRGIPGVNFFRGYLNDPERTDAAFDADGWFNTGDRVIVREDHQIIYAGRAKDMLKVGGENVAAVEIESVIARVAGVREVAVIGRPDPLFDEVPIAFVVCADPGDTMRAGIMAACEEKLATFKRPRAVIFRDALPKGLLDKILKRELKEEAAQIGQETAA